ncbi:MAG: hypothetical protein ACRDQ4_26685 [Pseudonocardiaceae bacterium]
MNTLNTPALRPASGITRRNTRTSGYCPRCHHTGVFAPDSIVCNRYADTRPTILTVTITVTLAAVGAER